MAEPVESGDFAPDLSEAVAAQSQVAIAPAVQEQTVVESTTTSDSLQTPVAQPAPSWREQVGIPGLESLDDAAAIERVRQIHQAGSQAYQQYQYEQYRAQQLQQQYAQVQAQLQAIQQAQQTAQQQVAAKPEPPKVPWEPVQLDDSYQDYLDPTSSTGWREGTPIQVVASYQKQLKALRDFQTKLYTKPHELLFPLIEERAKALVTPLEEKFAAIQAQMQEQEQRQQIAGLLGPLKDQFYALDQYGQPQRDQFGNPVLTQTGQAFNAYTGVIQQMGIQNPTVVAAVGALATERDALKAEVAALKSGQHAAAPAPAARQQHDAAIYQNGKPANGVNRIASHANTIAASANPNAPRQNEHTSLEDELRQSFRQLVGNGLG